MKSILFIQLILLLTLFTFSSAIAAAKGGNGGKGGNGSDKSNKNPVIRINYNASVNGNEQIVLDASRSQDRDGFITFYEWLSSDANLQLDGVNSPLATAIAPNENSQIAFTLTAIDNLGAISTRTVVVEVSRVESDSALLQPVISLQKNDADVQVSWNNANAATYRVLYWLEGFRPIEQVTSSNIITLSNLPAGTYTILVEAYDALGNSIFSLPAQIGV